VSFGQVGSFFPEPRGIGCTTFFLCLQLLVVQNPLLFSFRSGFNLLAFGSFLQLRIPLGICRGSLSLSLIFGLFSNLILGCLLSVSFGQVFGFFPVSLSIG